MKHKRNHFTVYIYVDFRSVYSFIHKYAKDNHCRLEHQTEEVACKGHQSNYSLLGSLRSVCAVRAFNVAFQFLSIMKKSIRSQMNEDYINERCKNYLFNLLKLRVDNLERSTVQLKMQYIITYFKNCRYIITSNF